MWERVNPRRRNEANGVNDRWKNGRRKGRRIKREEGKGNDKKEDRQR